MNSLKIKITNSSDLPFYQQIHDQIKSLILSEKLASGSVLPSIRFLAMELDVSVITTKRAYDELEREGLIDVIMGKGCFVKTDNSQFVHERLSIELDKALDELIKHALLLGIDYSELIRRLERRMKENN